MKRKVKKRIVRGVCLTLAAAAAAGLFLQTTMSVQAATAMPGIETIVKDNSEDKPFRILELVDNSADEKKCADYVLTRLRGRVQGYVLQQRSPGCPAGRTHQLHSRIHDSDGSCQEIRAIGPVVPELNYQ